MYAEVSFSIPVEQSFTYRVPQEYETFIKTGSRVLVPFGAGAKRGYVTALTGSPPTRRGGYPVRLSKVKEIKKLLDTSPPADPDLMALAVWLSGNFACSIGEALDCIFPLSCPGIKNGDPPQRDGFSGNFEVRSVSASDVAEREGIYVQTVKETVSSGGACILVVPELSAAEGLASRLRASLGDSVAVFHGGLPGKTKTLIWHNCISGKIKALVGTRVAVFAPLKDVKKIIVENEGNGLHKNPQKPFYDTVSVALERAKRNSCTAVLGSVIPALETYYRVKKGEYVSSTGRWRPPVVLIGQTRKYDRYVSPLLKAEIEKRILTNELSVVFVNRRGFSGAVSCPVCAGTPRCAKCGIPLVYHEKEKALKCHYCGYTEAFTGKCPACGGVYYFLGAGTERVLRTLAGIFPAAEIERVDSDVLSAPGARKNFTSKIAAGKTDIIVATQAISGFYRDFLGPSVKKPTLVAIQNTESLLYVPDFRALERAFMTLAEISQILDKRGVLLLQTANPSGEFFNYVNKFDWHGYYEKDISYREELGYPPATRLINLIIRSKSEDALEKYSEEAYKYLAQNSGRGATLLGPDEPPHGRIRGEYRRHILIKAATGNIEAVSSAIRRLKPRRGIKIAADVNPYEII